MKEKRLKRIRKIFKNYIHITYIDSLKKWKDMMKYLEMYLKKHKKCGKRLK